MAGFYLAADDATSWVDVAVVCALLLVCAALWQVIR